MVYPQVQKSFEPQHRAISNRKQIQHPGLDIPRKRGDLEIDLVRKKESRRYVRQPESVLEILD